MPGEDAGAVRPDERYEDLVDELVGTAGVTPPRGGGGFGRSGLRYQGRIFAMLETRVGAMRLPARLPKANAIRRPRLALGFRDNAM